MIAVLLVTQIFFGKASWYDSKSACPYNPNPQCPMASGESIYAAEKKGEHYAASWDFQFGQKIEVCNIRNNRCTKAIITDRGPARRLRRRIDLSKMAFAEIADPQTGVIDVTVQRIID